VSLLLLVLLLVLLLLPSCMFAQHTPEVPRTPHRTVQGSGGSSVTSMRSPPRTACDGFVTGTALTVTRPALMLALILALLAAGSAPAR
jgi:hypothetical protein